MSAAASFAESIRRIARGLRDDPTDPRSVNRAAGAVDGLGRRLHGLGLPRDREVADALSAAVRELGASDTLPADARAAAVGRAIPHLESAADHAAYGS